jgi:hypothetical protein
VRSACAEALSRLGQHDSTAMKTIATVLVQAVEDPRLDSVDNVAGRTGQDYAFDGLWTLLAGEHQIAI